MDARVVLTVLGVAGLFILTGRAADASGPKESPSARARDAVLRWGRDQGYVLGAVWGPSPDDEYSIWYDDVVVVVSPKKIVFQRKVDEDWAVALDLEDDFREWFQTQKDIQP